MSSQPLSTINVNISQRDADRIAALQVQQGQYRYRQQQKESEFAAREIAYKRIVELRKQLRNAEQEFNRLYQPREQPKVKKEKSLVLRNGDWVEV